MKENIEPINNMDKINYLVAKFQDGGKSEKMVNSAFKFFDNARNLYNRATSGNFLDRLWTRWTADDQSDAKTFDEAYSNARKNGSKTFLWNGQHYSTDYSGEHHKKYEEDVKSGKAEAWAKEYPGFTNPELRKAKQEELDTYGITNEQTQNKTWKSKLFRKIPAQGYDVGIAISSILNEHTPYSSYNTAEDYYKALRKKYPQFSDFPFEEYYKEVEKNGLTYTHENNTSNTYANKNNVDPTSFYEFLKDFLPHYSGGRKEIHRDEYDYLLGYPQNLLKISNYRTGNAPYYYTTNKLESGIPFPSNEWRKPIDWNARNHLIEKMYNNLELTNSIGVDLMEGTPYIYDVELFNNSTNPFKNELLQSGILPIESFPISEYPAGNYIGSQDSTNSIYYTAFDETLNNSKYKNLIHWLQMLSNKKNNLEPSWTHPDIIMEPYMMNTELLGKYTIGIPKDKSYFSIWDIFDINPFAFGNSKPIINIGKPFEYYTRFYKGKTPNIDSLYNNFKWTPNNK